MAIKQRIGSRGFWVTICALAAIVGSYFLPQSNLRWIEKVSSVNLPRGVRDVCFFSDREFYITAYMRLPMESLDKFTSRYRFRPVSSVDDLLIGVDGLDPRFNKIPEGADLIMHASRTIEHRWTFVLDRKSGSMWVTVLYPDMAGDPPP